MDSSSEQGVGSITLTFEAGTNLDVASVETQNRVKRAEARLPEDVRRVGVTVAKSARNYLMFVALISPDKSPRQRWRSAATPLQFTGKHPPCAGRGRSDIVRPPNTRCGCG